MTNNIEHILEYILKEQLTKKFIFFLKKSFQTINPDVKFQDNWHINLICDALENCNKGEIKRLIINIPPRSLKSVCISVAFPAWILGIKPSTRIIVSTYSNILSVKHATDCRKIMNSDWYQKLFKNSKIIYGSNTKNKFSTEKNGYYFATSTGGTILGEGGDILIADDPQSTESIYSSKLRNKTINWFKNSFSTRLNDKKNGIIIVLMQRLHEDDLSGFLLKNETEWQHIKLPIITDEPTNVCYFGKTYANQKQNEVIDKNRINQQIIDSLIKTMGFAAFSAQYKQNPIPATGNLIKKSWLKYYEQKDLINLDKTNVYISIDCAKGLSSNNDYTVIATILNQDGNYYILDISRQRIAYPELRKLTRDKIEKFKPKATLIEDTSNGSSLIQELKQGGYSGIIGIKPKRDKITRFNGALAIIESGNLMLPKDKDFTNLLISELLSFPFGKHDDQVDAIGQYFLWFLSKKATLNSTFKIRRI